MCKCCGGDWVSVDYDYMGVMVCEDCFYDLKIKGNLIGNKLSDNTFEYIKNDKSYFGNIVGYQHRKGYEDKFYVVLNINEDDYSIWINNWHTEKEMSKYIDSWKINIEELIK